MDRHHHAPAYSYIAWPSIIVTYVNYPTLRSPLSVFGFFVFGFGNKTSMIQSEGSMGIWQVWDLRGYLPMSIVHKIGTHPIAMSKALVYPLGISPCVSCLSHDQQKAAASRIQPIDKTCAARSLLQRERSACMQKPPRVAFRLQQQYVPSDPPGTSCSPIQT